MVSQQRTGQARDAATAPAGARSQPGGWPTRLARGAVIALIYLYQGVASVFPKVCRFEPSCSNYGLEAVRVHGAVTGGWLTLKRIWRCRPGGGFGVDPVPSKICAHDHDRPDEPAGTPNADQRTTRRRAAG